MIVAYRRQMHRADAIHRFAVIRRLHPNVVARVAVHHAVAHGAFEQHVGSRTDRSGAEVVMQAVAQRFEFGDAAVETDAGTLSGMSTAGVFGRSEKGKTCRYDGASRSRSVRVRSKSASLSLGKPVMTSMPMKASGMRERILAMRSANRSEV